MLAHTCELDFRDLTVKGYECATQNNVTEYADEYTQGNRSNHAKMQHFKVSYSFAPLCQTQVCLTA